MFRPRPGYDRIRFDCYKKKQDLEKTKQSLAQYACYAQTAQQQVIRNYYSYEHSFADKVKF